MRSERTSRRVLSWTLGLSLPMLIVGLAFWAQAAAGDGLELGVKAAQIEEGEARALAQQLKVAVVASGEGKVEVAMRVQALTDDVGAAGEPAAKGSGDSAATLAQKRRALRYTKRVRARAKQKGDVSRALLDDAAKLAKKAGSQKAGSGDAKQARKMGADAKQARKMGADAKRAKGVGGKGTRADRPHASPESLRGSKAARSGRTAAGSAKGLAKGSRAGAAKRGGGGSLLRSSSPGSKGTAGGAGKGKR